MANHLGYVYYDQKMLERAASQDVYDHTSVEEDLLYAQLSEDASGAIGELYETGGETVFG